MKTIALVACCGAKLPIAAPARDLYRSDLFRKARTWSERHAAAWFILSALHGVVEPGSILAPYNVTLARFSRRREREWNAGVAGRLRELVAAAGAAELVVLAGSNYCGWIPELTAAGVQVRRPMEGLGIGQQLSWLKRETVSRFAR